LKVKTVVPLETLAVSGHTATFTGPCVSFFVFNQYTPCTLSVTVVDGPPDSFGMTVSDPNVQNGPAVIASGLITFTPAPLFRVRPQSPGPAAFESATSISQAGSAAFEGAPVYRG